MTFKMYCRAFRRLSYALLMPLLAAAPLERAAASRPDVLFIVLDDMNDWISLLDPGAPVQTPHLQRLADRGMLFSRAYVPSPACNPSRSAILTGVSPATSGVYGNKSDWRGALPHAVTLPRHFMDHGYRVEGAGKIYHHHLAGAFHEAEAFHEFLAMPWPPDAPMPTAKLNRLPDYGSANTDWGPWPENEADALDVRSVDWCIRKMQEERPQPRFLACGLFRPHMPFFVPPAWLEKQPPAGQTVMPAMLENDLEDVPPGGRKLMKDAARFFTGMMKAEESVPGSWREAVRCYQASVRFADAQVGRLLDALDATPKGRDTVIVLWSDHGYQLGEKECWEKFTLWEKATRIPFIVVAPGLVKPGSICDRPVSLLDLYPTLTELCGLPSAPGLEGKSLLPLLKNPQSDWERPAVMTYLRGNHAVRSDRWRYIRYADGSEELYDHSIDPHEWHNLASKDELRPVMEGLKKWLPTKNAGAAPDKKEP